MFRFVRPAKCCCLSRDIERCRIPGASRVAGSNRRSASSGEVGRLAVSAVSETGRWSGGLADFAAQGWPRNGVAVVRRRVRRGTSQRSKATVAYAWRPPADEPPLASPPPLRAETLHQCRRRATKGAHWSRPGQPDRHRGFGSWPWPGGLERPMSAPIAFESSLTRLRRHTVDI